MASVDLPGLLNALAVPLLGIVTAGVGVLWRRGGGLRARLRADLELLKALPEGSQGRSRLQEHIDATVERLITVDGAMRRDWLGTALAVVLLIIAVLTGTTAWRLGGWWTLLWLPAVTFALLGAVGAGISVPRAERDEKGRRLKSVEPGPSVGE